MNQKKSLISWQIILIFIFSLIPLLWYKDHFIIANGDNFPYYFNSQSKFFYDLFVWDIRNGGLPSVWPTCIVIHASWYVLQRIGISIGIIQIIYLIFYFFGSGTSMFFLVKTIHKCDTDLPFPLVSSLFYMFNIFVLIEILNDSVRWTLVFLPLLLAFYIRLIEDINLNKNYWNNCVLFAIISTFLFSFASQNLPLIGIIVLSLVIFGGYYRVKYNYKSLKILCITFLLLILINIWWIIPIFYQVSFSLIHPDSLITTVTNVNDWAFTHQRASFLNLFWLNGIYSWSPEYIPFITFYSSFIVIFICFTPIIIGFSTLLLNKGRNLLICFISLVILLLLFLTKGLHSPFENINIFLYNQIPGMFMFREPYIKFFIIVAILLSILIGLFAYSVLSYIQETKWGHKTIITSIFLCAVVMCFFITTGPFLSSMVMDRQTDVLPYSAYVQIPSDWMDMEHYIDEKPGFFNILITPNNDYYQMPYTWGYYGADALPPVLLSKPTLQIQTVYVTNSNYNFMITKVFKSLMNANETQNYNEFSIFNIRYILQRNDIDSSFRKNFIPSAGDENKMLSEQIALYPEKSIGNLTLYAVSDDYVMPTIFSVSNFAVAPDLTSTATFMVSDSFHPENTTILTEDQEPKNSLLSLQKIQSHEFQITNTKNMNYQANLLFLNSSLPQHKSSPIKYFITIDDTKITNNNFPRDNLTFNQTSNTLNEKIKENSYHPLIQFTVINPTKYHVTINATQPFFLVFSESYNSQWKAYAGTNPAPMNDIIANYSRVNVQEAAQEMQFTPGDISYLLEKPLPEEDHFLVNGFANAWYIDPSQLPKDADGNIDITLYFWPQSLFYLGLIISGSTLVICIGYLVFNWNRGRRKKDDDNPED